MQPSSARTKRVHEGINSFARVLQPFGHQVSGVFGKSAGAIERLGSQIFAADFQAQGPDPGLSARLFGERDHGLAQLLPAIWFAQIELVEQGKAAVKLQAETIGDSEIAGKFSTAKDEVDLSMARIVEDLNGYSEAFETIYGLHIKNEVAPAVIFDPVLPGMKFETERRPAKISGAPSVAGTAPKNLEDVAFYSVRQLAELVRSKKVSSTALTQMYLERLKRYDPSLKFVITLTEDRATAHAKEADREISAGKYRGPLHGLPWGAKDLLAVKGYRTTWGAGGFEEQNIDEDAAVVKRLDQAGAVLVAKLALGALALGDVWFGGITRNPWNTNQGSSGSSAGPAS